MPSENRPEPEKQHVVPACYLAHFTRESDADRGCLWVIDRKLRRQWKSSPRNAGRHTNFYTGDFGSGIDSYGVEKAFSRLEATWSNILRRINETARLPKDDTEEFADLMGFVAFQTMRTPSTREYISELMDASSKAELIAGLTDVSKWDGFVDHMREIGESVTICREELLESAKEGDFIVTADKRWAIQTQLASAIQLMLHFAQREWSLFSAEDNAPDFICSDSPVCVTSADNGVGREQGFVNERSVVTIPLGRRHALAGFYEGSLDMVLPEVEVAGLNSMTLYHGNQIYSASPTFRYARADGQIADAQDFHDNS